MAQPNMNDDPILRGIQNALEAVSAGSLDLAPDDLSLLGIAYARDLRRSKLA